VCVCKIKHSEFHLMIFSHLKPCDHPMALSRLIQIVKRMVFQVTSITIDNLMWLDRVFAVAVFIGAAGYLKHLRLVRTTDSSGSTHLRLILLFFIRIIIIIIIIIIILFYVYFIEGRDRLYMYKYLYNRCEVLLFLFIYCYRDRSNILRLII
jgi:small-conductance mechanosensitive channel